MKRFFLLFASLLSLVAYAQNSGLGFNYQAVVRKTDGMLLANSDVNLRISLYPGQSATTPTWVEEHKVRTDTFGSFGITVGKGVRSANSVAAKYADVNFAAVFYWMKIEIQEGSDYREVCFSQLPSSPYAEVAHNASTFAGMIAPFAGPAENVPAGWLLCDGHAISRSEYINLYNAIGVAWGEGDGSSTFNLPDLRGMFLRGVSGDSGNDADAESRGMLANNGSNTGNNVGSYQGDAIRNIIGKMGGSAYSQVAEGPFFLNGERNMGTGYGGANYEMPTCGFDVSRAKDVFVGADNRPKNVYVTYIIKY